jgi:hypothetical protein
MASRDEHWAGLSVRTTRSWGEIMTKLLSAVSALLGLGGAFAAVAVTLAPDPAWSQSRTSRNPGKRPPAAAPAQVAGGLDLVRGEKEAPAAVQAAGLRCSVTAAAFLGVASARNAYEVACSEGLGYLVLVAATPGAAAPQTVDCVSAQTTARLEQAAGRPAPPQCRLPANANPAQGLQTLAREAGAACTVNNARAVGRLTATAATRYEIGCSEGAGYVLDRPDAGGRPSVQTCFRAESAAGAQFRCEFTTRAQSLAALNPLIRSAGRTCTISDARLAGVNTTTRNEVLEVGCQGAAGFFIETAPATGAFVRAVDCGRLGSNQCQFTAAATVQARNAQDYTQLLKAAGYDCTVSNFNRQGQETSGREIVEAACSNRPEGVFALLAPAGTNARSDVADCLLAAARFRQNCTLTQVSAVYPAITRSLPAQKIGRDCRVTGTRVMGATPQGENWVEIGCSNGRSYVIDYRGQGRVQNIVACGQATEILGGCRRAFPDSKPAGAGG